MGSADVLTLEYILIGTLPREVRGVLLKRLEKAKARVRLMGEDEICTADAARLMRILMPYEGKNSLLVSGAATELAVAAELGMASVCFQPKDADGPRGVMADMYAEGFDEVDEAFFLRVFQRHHGLPWTILTTERCVVKEFSMEYLDDLFELYAGEGMTDYIEPLYPYEEERAYQEAYIRNMYGFYGYGMWIVCGKETGRLIGRAGIESREEMGGELELGYAIGTPFQRQGYATEVCGAIIRYAWEELAADRLHCMIEEGNAVSEQFAKKLGFSYTETVCIDGKRMKKYELEKGNVK